MAACPTTGSLFVGHVEGAIQVGDQDAPTVRAGRARILDRVMEVEAALTQCRCAVRSERGSSFSAAGCEISWPRVVISKPPPRLGARRRTLAVQLVKASRLLG